MADQRTHHARVGDDQRRGRLESSGARGDVTERGGDPVDDCCERLERCGPVVRLEPSRPSQLDLLRRQTLPLSGVRLS